MTDITITADMIEYGDDFLTVTLPDSSRFKIEFENDYDSTPDDIEGLPEEYVRGWQNDDWHFVGVIVTPLDVPESVQFRLSDSLWGLEFDFPLNPPQEINGRTFRYTDANYQIMHYPVPGMIEQVQFQVKAWQLEVAWHNFAFA